MPSVLENRQASVGEIATGAATGALFAGPAAVSAAFARVPMGTSLGSGAVRQCELLAEANAARDAELVRLSALRRDSVPRPWSVRSTRERERSWSAAVRTCSKSALRRVQSGFLAATPLT